ncbi:N-acetylglucosamine-binding protein GbpA [Pseudomonas sichuanensis]|uniref:N-acetylglucosamine-binding protein GbpA n=1 Tax=Pseudomonas sichuanensis TaxID=2213015 RepID=UPI00244CD1D2|nr:N-acetylglucosamine-binding protein GbpA [Pseudomonas sichuanensis]MDH0730839.1 N-acetylglucosamine-binding protein GbpA [Pseudomonas sichuanensis]MDH1582036.1 N-acetylglucosamine-binding protein GbpA [Pseudomonas sichuanensis]MDH1594563.1 N-acetylglucosamine-binding protein GbpA [Pseudomonas sichuanensis]MDH1596591.1 N-acetylglucosamine-binding protein GbpA [Pseudomonas sichuanensis]
MNKGKATSKGLFASSLLAAIAAASSLPQLAHAHGYVSDPPSRAYACKLGLNQQCGQAQYEPQSVGEAPKGFPASGPADGKIASGGVRGDFSALDEQSATRWKLTSITQRELAFDWYYTIGHPATKFEYFITKTGWNANEPLTRAAFELTPFCTVDGKGELPGDGHKPGPAREKHHCTLPADRAGQHVILGAWTVHDTPAAFYNVMDVDIQIEGGTPPEWPQVGSITPHRDLRQGDKVKARAFIGTTESAQHSVNISIDNAEDGIGARWSHKLAKRINATQPQIKAGQADAQGDIRPVLGTNLIFAKAASGVTSYQLDFETKPVDDAYLHLHGIKPEYALKDGKGTVDFSVMTNRKLQVTSQLFDEHNQQVGHASQLVDASTASVALEASSGAGKHLLKVVGVDVDNRVMLQEEREVRLLDAGNAEHDFVFPQSIETYRAGTLVLQSKTGEVFECKPFPAEGWCRIYSSNANQYEPGVGSHWQDAWIKR